MAIREFLKNYSKAIIPSILLVFGQQLAEYVTKTEVSLSYEIEKFNVGSTTALYIKISNELSHTGINSLLISKPTDNILKTSFSPLSGPVSNELWSGSLASNSYMEALFISDDKISTDHVDIVKVIEAKYESPKLIQESVKVIEKAFIPLNSIGFYIFLLLLPNLIASIAYAVYLKYFTSD